jgi:hypothetical protein
MLGEFGIFDIVRLSPKEEIRPSPPEGGGAEQDVRPSRLSVRKLAIIIGSVGVTICWAVLLVWLLIKLIV